jgi:hypothetical protein
MHYTNSRNPEKSEETHVKLSNETLITPSQTQKWLEIWLDSKHSWKEHIERRSISAM